MALRTCDSEEEPETLRYDVVYSLGKCEANRFGVAFVPLFLALLDEWQVVFAKHLVLRDKISRAESRIDGCDDELDIFVDDVAATLLLLYKTRDSAEFREFFGSKQPYEVKHPILGEELETVRAWITALKASSNMLLQTLGERGEELVKNADAAVATLAAAVQEFRTFRLTGEYSQFVDNVNRVRKTVYAELSKLPHQPEGKGLPGDFADRFFRHETRRNKRLTLDSVQKQIDALQAQLKKLEGTRTDLQNKEAERLAEITERAKLQAELLQAEQIRKEAEKKEEELRAKLKK